MSRARRLCPHSPSPQRAHPHRVASGWGRVREHTHTARSTCVDRCAVYTDPLKQGFAKGHPQTSCMNVTNSRAPPQTYWFRNWAGPVGGLQQLGFEQAPRVLPTHQFVATALPPCQHHEAGACCWLVVLFSESLGPRAGGASSPRMVGMNGALWQLQRTPSALYQDGSLARRARFVSAPASSLCWRSQAQSPVHVGSFDAASQGLGPGGPQPAVGSWLHAGRNSDARQRGVPRERASSLLKQRDRWALRRQRGTLPTEKEEPPPVSRNRAYASVRSFYGNNGETVGVNLTFTRYILWPCACPSRRG